MNEINDLYGGVNNLQPFTHPTYERGFEFLSNENAIKLAKRTVDEIVSSGYEQVVVAESGAVPFAYICEQISEQEGLNLDWVPFKVPRNPMQSIYLMLEHYLSDVEKTELVNGINRLEAIKKTPYTLPEINSDLEKVILKAGTSNQRETQKAISYLLKGTYLDKIFSKPFIYFDEYVHSGTTLASAQYHYNHFTADLDFKIGSYMVHATNTNRFDRLAFTLYDKDSEFEAYSNGAYPYENRLDLIGYFYQIDENNFSKVDLKDLTTNNNKEDSLKVDSFIKDLRVEIQKTDLINTIKNNSEVSEVSNYLDENQVLRYALTVFEEESFGKNTQYEFLWQLFDMYGPIWTPMPRENHFDFWSTFEKSDERIRESKFFQTYKHNYEQNRTVLISNIASVCLDRRDKWLNNIEELLEAEK